MSATTRSFHPVSDRAVSNFQTKPSRFLSLKPGEVIEVSGMVESISPVPRPGTVPYKDHITALHLIDIVAAGGDRGSEGQQKSSPSRGQRPRATTGNPGGRIFVEHARQRVDVAARLRPGDRIKLRLRPWPDVSAEYEKFNCTELDDPALQLEEPVWGEEVETLNR
jgi:alginate O-acetyltransferase complex protein AlgJ